MNEWKNALLKLNTETFLEKVRNFQKIPPESKYRY